MKHAWILLALAACHAAPEKLSLPDPGLARTAIYLVVGTGSEPRVFVTDLGDPQLPELGRVAGQQLAIYALYYRCPASVLGLELGEAPLVSGGHPIPPSNATFGATLNDDGITAWTPTTYPPMAADVRIARQIRCATFELTINSIATSTRTPGPAWVAEVGEDEVLVSIPDDGFYRIRPNGQAVRVESMNGLPGQAYFLEREDRAWLYGKQNQLAVGDLRTGQFELVDVPPIPFARSSLFTALLAGSNPGSPFELYVAHDMNVIQRFDGERWTEIYRGPRPSYGRDYFFTAGLAWVRPGEAMVASVFLPTPALVRTASVGIDPSLDLGESDYFSTAGNVPGLGLAVGTWGGAVHVKSASGWTRYGDAPVEGQSSPDVADWAPLDDGLLITGGVGQFTQLQPRLDRPEKYCHFEKESERAVEGSQDPRNRLASFTVGDLQPLGCGFVFTARSSRRFEVEIGFLKRK